MQTAIHTETGNAGFGSGVCDRNGCFARVGGPQSPRSMQGHYGQGKTIDSMQPFRVTTHVDDAGAMSIMLGQNGNSITSFDRRIAGGLQWRAAVASRKRTGRPCFPELLEGCLALCA